VLDEVVDNAAQMTLAEWDNVTEAFFRAHESFRVGVQIRTARGQAHELDVGVGEEALELRGIERVAVHDQVAEAAKRARHGVGEISRDLRHPGAVGGAGAIPAMCTRRVLRSMTKQTR